MNLSISFRLAKPDDLSEVIQLFRESIETLTRDTYTSAQRNAWQSGSKDHDKWLKRIKHQHFLLAKVQGMLAGFGSMEGDYVDLLYVHPDFSGKGVAHHIYEKLEAVAKQNSYDLLKTDASKVARPFFERQGFRVQWENQIHLDGQILVNYRMVKHFPHLQGL